MLVRERLVGLHRTIQLQLLQHYWLWHRDWGQEEKGTTGDEMAGWHHQLDGHEFE